MKIAFIRPNLYPARSTDALGPVVWIMRLVMIAAVVLHVALSLQITLENSEAKPQKYAVDRSLRATFAGKHMIHTGLIIAAFLGYHLLHFTFRVTPGLALGADAAGRFDVFTMVVSAFSSAVIALVYVVAMVALFLHLSHGIQSTFQTLGLSNGKLLPAYDRFGKVEEVAALICWIASDPPSWGTSWVIT